MNLWGTVVASGGRVPPGVWMMLAVVNLVVTVLTWSGARRRMRRAGERAADSQLVAGGAARTRDTAVLAAGVEREILWRLHTGPQGATVRQIGPADSRLTHLASTIRWIRAHYNETLRIQDLAALATMSVSSFHRHFRAMTSGLAP
jgi:hypothetical protein